MSTFDYRFLFIASSVMSACTSWEPEAIEAADFELSQTESISTSPQQVEYYEAWLEARTPSDHVRATLLDSEGFSWNCVDVEHQPAFRRGTIARARMAASIIDEETATGRTVSESEISVRVEEALTLSSGVYEDIDADAARAAIEAALMESDSAEPDLEGTDSGLDTGENGPGSDQRGDMDISGICPEGTVPIEAWSADQIAARGGLEAFLNPEPPSWYWNDHEYGTARDIGTFSGGKANINVWNPYVERTTEFSLAQIWLSRGTGDDLQTVEAGWQDYFLRTFSAKPRLFVFSTSDNYDTGCYNNNCGDWVQTSSTVSLNMTWSNFSTQGGAQYSNEYRYWRSDSTGNWYFVYDGETVGYYPGSLFDSAGLSNHASRLTFGGEIVNFGGFTHTKTDMGSGADASGGWTYSTYIRDMHSRTTDPVYLDFEVDVISTEPGCYDAADHYSTGENWEVYMYFGGEGYNPSYCL